MWKVLALLVLAVIANCEPYSKKHPSRNQRIIKVQGPPHYNHYHGGQKPYRKRPIGLHYGEELIRPNHPPPIPPFFNGPSLNHKKHLPRPPPHVYHKLPSYGLGYPYKSVSSFRPTLSKDHFRVSSRPTSSGSLSGSSSTSYHSPTFTTSSFVSSHASSGVSSPPVSPPVSHIISSDDNNGPIREIPAPNLGPKSHDEYGVIGDVGGVGGIGVGDIGYASGVGSIGYSSGVSDIGHVSGVAHIGGSHLSGVSHISGGHLGGVADIGGVSQISGGHIGGVSQISGGHIGGVSQISGGHIGGVAHIGDGHIGGVSVGHVGGVSDGHIGGAGVGHIGVSAVASSGSLEGGNIAHVESEAVVNSVGKEANVNLDAIVKDPGIESDTYINIKETGEDTPFGKDHTVEIANFDEGSSIDVTKLIKNAAAAEHNSGYEVTEHHNHLPSNDQIIKGHDGTKLYYAPDPDPSLPVHKVPPTNDPHSTPSNGQVFLPQVSYLPPGGPMPPLSSQELFHLMHGYPVVQQPLVAFVSQPQDVIRNLAGGTNYYQSGHAGGGDINQYLQQPDIHNLLHNTGKPHQDHEGYGTSHSSVVAQNYPQQPAYSPQNQYQTFIQSQYDKTSGPTKDDTYPEINHNYQYEPEASESNNKNSLTVIRNTQEGTLNSETVKELLLEDATSNELNEPTPQNHPTILQLKNIPEVPFYASLPSQKAAEALATLQAAGSVASNYMNRIKITRGDQGPEEDTRERRRKLENDVEYSQEDDGKTSGQKTVVEIQQSVPLYETSISSTNLVPDEDGEEDQNVEFSSVDQDEGEDDLSSVDLKEDDSSPEFGKRLKPK